MRYFVSFVHKSFPRGVKEFGNCIIELEPGETFDVREIENKLQKEHNDVTILYFHELLNGEK